MYFCCCCSGCCYPAVAAAAVLLFAAAVRHRVPADTIWCCGLFIASDSSVSFSWFKNDFFLMYIPLGSTAVACTASILPIQYVVHTILVYSSLVIYGHARSQSGRQPAAAKLPLYILVIIRITSFKKKLSTIDEEALAETDRKTKVWRSRCRYWRYRYVSWL